MLIDQCGGFRQGHSKRQYDPQSYVLKHGIAQQQTDKPGAHDAQIPEDARDHGNRSHRGRNGHHQQCGRLLARGAGETGERYETQKTQTKNEDEARRIRNGDEQQCLVPILFSQQPASLCARAEHKQNQTELVKKAESRVRTRCKGKEFRIGRRDQQFECEWSKQHAGEDFPHNTRLLQAFREVSQPVNGCEKCGDGEYKMTKVRSGHKSSPVLKCGSEW